MKAFEIAELVAKRSALGKPMLEFLREKMLSVCLYTLPPGGPDPQHPHEQDEVYYVISGRARIQVGLEEQEVQPGSVVYVPARIDHHFFAILEELQVLVFFAPGRSGN